MSGPAADRCPPHPVGVSPRFAEAARVISTFAAVLAAAAGVLIVREAAVRAFTPTGGREFRSLGEAGVLIGSGPVLLGYALAHLVFCWRRSGRAVVARAAFTTAVVAGASFLSWRVVAELAAPPDPGPRCGMSWLADLAPLVGLVLVCGFVAVEVAAWVGWLGGPRPAPGSGPALGPGGERGRG